MSRAARPQVVTANDLFEGDVVWLTPEGGWTRCLSEAEILRDPDTASAKLALAEAQSDRVIGPYLAEVDSGPDGRRPRHFRERVRVSGPSIRPIPLHPGE